MHERTKDVQIGEYTYQIGELSAFDGSWLLLQILPKVTEAMGAAGSVNSENKEQAQGVLVYALLGRLADTQPETLKMMQQKALSVCRRYEKNMPMPIFEPPAKWHIKEMQGDVMTVMMLSVHAIVHNISPFFQGQGLSGLMESIFPASTPQNSLV